MQINSMVENPAIRPVVLAKAIKNIIDYEKVAALKTAIDILEEVCDQLVFPEADVCRAELHRVMRSMQNDVDRMEIENINPCFNVSE